MIQTHARFPLLPATIRAAAAALIACASPEAHAHLNSLTMCEAELSGRTIRLKVDTTRADLAEALGLAATAVPTRTQIVEGRDRIARYLAERIVLTSAGHSGRPSGAAGIQVAKGANGQVRITRVLRFPALVESVCVDYRLFFDLDPGHRSLWTFYAHGVQKNHLFVSGIDGRRAGRRCVRFPSSPAARLIDRMALASNRAWIEPATWLGAAALLLCLVLMGAALPAGSGRARGLALAAAAFCLSAGSAAGALLAFHPVEPIWPVTSLPGRTAAAGLLAATASVLFWTRRRAARRWAGRGAFAALAGALGALSSFLSTAPLPCAGGAGGQAALLGLLAGNQAVVLSQALMAVLAAVVALRVTEDLRRPDRQELPKRQDRPRPPERPGRPPGGA